mmetsp:Transcript_1943/g.3486  ORF Transcript_1943/g.3486 Transcript_1943/m.3486 type:complete len:99 (-) Transcript_1943:523-819(-)
MRKRWMVPWLPKQTSLGIQAQGTPDAMHQITEMSRMPALHCQIQTAGSPSEVRNDGKMLVRSAIAKGRHGRAQSHMFNSTSSKQVIRDQMSRLQYRST